MNKELRNVIMTRTCPLNNFRKHDCSENHSAYKMQHNFCVALLKRSKKVIYNNLNMKKISDNKSF